MNGKQAKRLRKMAEVSGLPVENNYEAVGTYGPWGYRTIVLSECVRALYKEIKKNFKKGEMMTN